MGDVVSAVLFFMKLCAGSLSHAAAWVRWTSREIIFGLDKAGIGILITALVLNNPDPPPLPLYALPSVGCDLRLFLGSLCGDITLVVFICSEPVAGCSIECFRSMTFSM